MGAPFGLLYSPMRPIDGLVRLEREPVRCSHCAGVLNPFASVDVASRRWQCSLCSSVSELPTEIAYASSQPAELQHECATIEYAIPQGPQLVAGSALLLVLDCSLPADELDRLGAALKQILAGLPPDTPVSLRVESGERRPGSATAREPGLLGPTLQAPACVTRSG